MQSTVSVLAIEKQNFGEKRRLEGGVFVLLKDENVEDFLAIEGETRDEFFQIGEEVKEALRTLFKPDKMNYAALSNNSPAIHVHIIPR